MSRAFLLLLLLTIPVGGLLVWRPPTAARATKRDLIAFMGAVTDTTEIARRRPD